MRIEPATDCFTSQLSQVLASTFSHSDLIFLGVVLGGLVLDPLGPSSRGNNNVSRVESDVAASQFATSCPKDHCFTSVKQPGVRPIQP